MLNLNYLDSDATVSSNSIEGTSGLSLSSSTGINSNISQRQHQKQVNKYKSTFALEKCKICDDKATGVHYGILTCEGCKVNKMST